MKSSVRMHHYLMPVAIACVISWVIVSAHPVRDFSKYDNEVPPETDEVTFIGLGDQGTTDFRQRRVAALLEKKCRSLANLDSIHLLGDNFYFNGVDSINDELWNDGFENMYSTPCLSTKNFFAVLGNHDYIKNPFAQIEYSRWKKGSGRWNMPGRTYVHEMGIVDGKPLVRILMLDTIITLERQIAVIKEVFGNRNNSIWNGVSGHFNMRTFSEKYHSDERTLKILLPLLKEYGVHFYLSGHSHSLQLIEMTDEPIYIVSGGGGKRPRPLIESPSTELKYGVSKLGFVTLHFTAKELALEYLSTTATWLDTFQTSRRNFVIKRDCLEQQASANCVQLTGTHLSKNI